MTDLSKHSLAELEAQREAINAEIERRKAEPDYAAWKPKWQAFREAMGWAGHYYPQAVERYTRALIAAHNTPLAGDEWTEYQPSKDGAGPKGVSLETHEVEFFDVNGKWAASSCPFSAREYLYRYRPKQTDDWIPWTGGECPVAGDTRVDLGFKFGGYYNNAIASLWNWGGDGWLSGNPIIAYRVVKP